MPIDKLVGKIFVGQFSTVSRELKSSEDMEEK
jgi:hypothetical protein